jgi:nucleotide-binding universal stress UspA family protein
MDSTKNKDYIDQLDALLEGPSVESDAHSPSGASSFRVLLAITDDDLAPAATAVVHALHEGLRASPSVLYVIEVGPAIPEAAAVAVSLQEELRNPRSRAKQEAQMRSVLHIDSGAPATWPFSIDVGIVAGSIIAQAQRTGADMVVMGLNRHAAISRMMGNDTVREVMTLGGVPVLAVRPQLVALPRRVVVAVDFSQASIRAAHLARRLLEDHGSMHLLFVEPAMLDNKSESTEGMRLIQTRGVEAAFAQLVSELKPSPGMTIATIVRRGNPMAEISRFCEEVRPDLVALGSQRHRFLDRLLLGSVARSVAADGRWSTLVTPPTRAARS